MQGKQQQRGEQGREIQVGERLPGWIQSNPKGGEYSHNTPPSGFAARELMNTLVNANLGELLEVSNITFRRATTLKSFDFQQQ